MKKPESNRKSLSRKKQALPRGWNEKKLKEVIAYYDNQSEDEALAEYEDGMEVEGHSLMLVPTELVSEVRQFIERRSRASRR